MTDADLEDVMNMAYDLMLFHKENDNLLNFKYDKTKSEVAAEIIADMRNGHNFLVAEADNGTILGYTNWSIHSSGTATDIKHLYIKPSYRSKGYGRKLLNETILQMRHAYPNIKGFNISVAPWNVRACQLYEDAGFELATYRLFFKA